MIDGIGAFSSVFLQGLAQSANADGQRNNRDSGNRGSSSAPVLNNTDATGLKISAEQRRAIQERQRNDRNGNGQSGQMPEAPRSPVTRGLHGYARAAASAETESSAVSRQQARGMAFDSSRSFSQGRSFVSQSSLPHIDMERAAAAYKRMGGETGLAPFGTGISLRV